MANVLYTVRPDALLKEAQSIETSAKENQKSWIILGQLDKYGEALKTANLLRRAAAEKSVYTRREILRNAGYTVKSPKALSQNPRPRKYASDAERQAAFRNRASMLEFRADEKTAEKLTEIADTLDISRSDLLLSMVKFALTNHQWARFGLTHKTLPRYEENPMATKKFSPAQIAAQKLFAERARAGTLGKTVKRNPVTKNNLPDYRKKTDEQLQFIMKDASEAARAMRGLDARAEAKYLDQINDASTVLYERAAKFRERKTNPAPENDFVKKIVANIKRRMKSFGDPYEKAKSLSLLGFNYDDKMSALIDEQFSKRATKPKYSAAAVNKAIASSRSKISASEGKTIHRLLKGRHGNPAGYFPNPKVKYTNRAKDMKGDQRVGYAVHMADRPSYQAIAWFSKKDDAVKVAQEASDRTGKQLAVTRVQNYFGAM